MKIDSNGIQINIRELGKGELALLFLHYWGGSSRTWSHVTAELSKNFRTIALDHRGWGESDAPKDGYRIADLADDAQGVIQALKLERYVIVGHSMGGKVAQLLASRRPSGLKGLVLVAPSPPSPTDIPDEQIEAMKHAYDSRESIGFVVDNILTGSPLTERQREQVIADGLDGAPRAKLAWPTEAIREDISQNVAFISVPTLVVGGELDKVDSVEMLRREVIPRISNSRMRVIPGVGHLSPLEQPDTLASEILAFVSATA
jgi:pimeloyl-ACP methyl ester carboxylesterase